MKDVPPFVGASLIIILFFIAIIVGFVIANNNELNAQSKMITEIHQAMLPEKLALPKQEILPSEAQRR